MHRAFVAAALMLIAIVAAPAVASTRFVEGDGFQVFEFRNETIATNNSLVTRFRDVTGFQSLDFSISQSSGSIVTANVSWETSSGTEIDSDTLTSGSEITKMKSPFAKITIDNSTAGAITVTGNILLSGAKKNTTKQRFAEVESQITTTTNAYAVGELIGNIYSLQTTDEFNGHGLIHSITISDDDNQQKDLDVVFFNTYPSNTTFTDNAELDIADADLEEIAGVVRVETHRSFADNSVSTATNLSLPFKLTDGRKLFAAIVAQEGVTYSATDALKLKVNVIEY